MKHMVRVNIIRLLAVLLALPALNAMADPTQAWSLRNFYRIPVEHGIYIYAEDNAESRVFKEDNSVLFDKIGFSIELADGTVLNGDNLEAGGPSRDPFNDVVGEGTTYSVRFAPKNGLEVTHVLRTFKGRPFIFIEIHLENKGTTDIAIANIHPFVAGAVEKSAFGPETRVRYRRVQDMGGHTVIVDQDEALMAVLHDPSNPTTFGFGIVPVGQAHSSVAFRDIDGQWRGDATCAYAPAKTLAAGQKLMSDPLWISYGVAEAHRVDLNYSWAYSMYVNSPDQTFLPRGWYTLGEMDGLNDYVAAGEKWKDLGIDHVLVGRGWEGRPGSMQGAASRFPKSMDAATETLVKSGMHVGFTIDPLIASEGGAEWTADSADGQSWINPAAPGAAQILAQKISTLKSWGASFVVVDKTLMPDSILQKFHLTRSEAQHIAYKSLCEAAAPLPVFPASVQTTRADVDDWLDAGGSVARMAVYGVAPGPLQFDTKSDTDLSEDFVTAASLWPGPIEFHGTATRQQHDRLAELILQKRVPGQPMDADQRAPRTWSVTEYDTDGKVVSEKTISLNGALPARAEKTDTSNKVSAAS